MWTLLCVITLITNTTNMSKWETKFIDFDESYSSLNFGVKGDSLNQGFYRVHLWVNFIFTTDEKSY